MSIEENPRSLHIVFKVFGSFVEIIRDPDESFGAARQPGWLGGRTYRGHFCHGFLVVHDKDLFAAKYLTEKDTCNLSFSFLKCDLMHNLITSEDVDLVRHGGLAGSGWSITTN